jgi:hypothetical protein
MRALLARAITLVLAGLSLAGVLAVTAGPAAASGTYSTTALVNVRTGPSTGYAIIKSEPNGATFTLICQWQGGTNINGNATWDEVRFSNGVVGAITDYWTTTPSWNSFAPGTGPCPRITPQMQDAANWAIAEKNSPDPTWSDHFGHPWSGYCEQFAEQAEGFAFRFPSAIDDYYWARNNGRIHTDTNPPPGALVFYGGGGGYGHVAVSIGNGQEVGTLGYVGQRLPVSQYPVVGYLSNPYLGWAMPIGS